MTYGIGPNPGSVVYFREENDTLEYVPPPKGSFMSGSEVRQLASGGTRYVGFPKVRWHWDFFRAEWYDLLKAYCPGSSGTVVIDTTINDNEDEFCLFWVKYHWPLELEKDSHRRMDFNVDFLVVPPGEIERILATASQTVTVTTTVTVAVGTLPLGVGEPILVYDLPDVYRGGRDVSRSESITVGTAIDVYREGRDAAASESITVGESVVVTVV